MGPVPLSDAAVREEFAWLVQSSRAPRPRTIRKFAADELIIPDGKHKGRRFRVETQPWAGLLLDAMDSHVWPRIAIVGCVQSGKTLIGTVLPTLYTLFELQETAGYGLPTMDMSKDKWAMDLRPAIDASRYRAFLPTSGSGSRGGCPELIQFLNGATLRFLGGRGGDENRSGFTTRVVVVTEADKMDKPGQVSREADPITQMEARADSYGDDRWVIMECTVSVEEGRIWREYQKGTRSKIVCPCPHCGRPITPERESLKGWEEAETIEEAREAAYWECPECYERFGEAERREANQHCRLVHRGQELDDRGEIVGRPIPTDTLGFRWNAFNNLFWTTAFIAGKEWSASRALDDEETAEREMRQFFWATPAKPPGYEEITLSSEGLLERVDKQYPRGRVPAWCELLTIGVDMGKFLAHWTATAWCKNGTSHVVEYGRFDVPSDQFAIESAIHAALLEFFEMASAGWAWENHPELLVPAEVWVDARYKPRAVYGACRSANQAAGFKTWHEERYRPTLGYGADQERFKSYAPPKDISGDVVAIGDGYHLAYHASQKIVVAHVNADEWKTRLWEGLNTPLGTPGLTTVHAAPAKEHLAWFKHLTSEKPTRQFVQDRGYVTKWKRVRRQNHWIDSGQLACGAGHRRGVRVPGTDVPAPAPGKWFGAKRRAT